MYTAYLVRMCVCVYNEARAKLHVDGRKEVLTGR